MLTSLTGFLIRLVHVWCVLYVKTLQVNTYRGEKEAVDASCINIK